MPPLEDFEIESEAEAIYRAAKLDPSIAVHPERIARRLPGLRGVEYAANYARDARLVANDDGTFTIRLGGGLSPKAAHWRTAHEIAEFVFSRGRRPYVGPDKERVMNYVAGAVVVTRSAMTNLYGVYGYDFARLAGVIGTTQTVTALRIGEALNTPIALVGPHHVVRRGPAHGLPGDAELFGLVRRSGSGPRGFRVAKLDDAPWVWAILPEW